MSSAAKHQRVCPPGNETTSESPPPSIPVDLILDILARSDMATILRCAATSKPMRRAILGPEFRQAIALRPTGGFDPGAFLGFSYVYPDSHGLRQRAAQTVRRNVRFNAFLLNAFEPVAARGGLIVLRYPEIWGSCGSHQYQLRVCNTITGETFVLPPATVEGDEYAHPPAALLAVGDAGRSFELLVARDACLWRTQTFSSKNGRWGAVVETDSRLPPHSYGYFTGDPVILGGAVPVIYWLCYMRAAGGDGRYCVRALDVGANQATQIEVPPDYRFKMICSNELPYHRHRGIMLATSADGRRVSLLVSEILTISMWTLEEDEGDAAAGSTSKWARQVVMRKEPIYRDAIGACPAGYSVYFRAFGEKSGAVIMDMDGVGLVHLNLGSKEAVVIAREHGFKPGNTTAFFQLCLHEIDLPSLLQTMKTF